MTIPPFHRPFFSFFFKHIFDPKHQWPYNGLTDRVEKTPVCETVVWSLTPICKMSWKKKTGLTDRGMVTGVCLICITTGGLKLDKPVLTTFPCTEQGYWWLCFFQNLLNWFWLLLAWQNGLRLAIYLSRNCMKCSQNVKNVKRSLLLHFFHISHYFCRILHHFTPGAAFLRNFKGFYCLFSAALMKHEIWMKYEKCIASVSYFVVCFAKTLAKYPPNVEYNKSIDSLRSYSFIT